MHSSTTEGATQCAEKVQPSAPEQIKEPKKKRRRTEISRDDTFAVDDLPDGKDPWKASSKDLVAVSITAILRRAFGTGAWTDAVRQAGEDAVRNLFFVFRSEIKDGLAPQNRAAAFTSRLRNELGVRFGTLRGKAGDDEWTPPTLCDIMTIAGECNIPAALAQQWQREMAAKGWWNGKTYVTHGNFRQTLLNYAKQRTEKKSCEILDLPT